MTHKLKHSNNRINEGLVTGFDCEIPEAKRTARRRNARWSESGRSEARKRQKMLMKEKSLRVRGETKNISK